MESKEIPTAKFPFGSRILINKNVAGIVLYSYNMYMPGHKPYFIYRIIVDANDLCHRVENNHINQVGDEILLREDFDNLISTTKQIAVLETGEEKLSRFEGVIQPLGEDYDLTPRDLTSEKPSDDN